MAKTRSTALNCYLYMIAGLFVRAASASENAPLPKLTDGEGGFTIDSGLWRVLIALLVLVGLVLLTQWIIRQRRRSGLGHLSSGRAIRIVDRKAIGPRQCLLLVQVGKRRVLLHQGKGAISSLCEFDAEAEEPTL